MTSNHLPEPSITPEDIDRFWKKILRGSPTDCWPWQGARSGHGNHKYGSFVLNRKGWKANRIAYWLFYNQWPGDLLVCHHCDNPICCNPHHLFLGTTADNVHDAMRKNGHLIGEKSPNAKLTEDDVRDIHRLLAAGYSARHIAEMRGVDPAQIGRIKRGLSWKHLHPGITYLPATRKRSGSISRCLKNAEQLRKLSPDQLSELKQLVDQGIPKRQCAAIFGVHEVTIYRSWKLYIKPQEI